MSYILDALQRSERERGEADGPRGPVPTATSQRGNRRAFAALIAALLLLNGVALGAWGLWRATADTVTATAPDPPRAVPAASGRGQPEPPPSTLALAAEAGRDVPAAAPLVGANVPPLTGVEAASIAEPETPPPAPKPDAARQQAAAPKKAAVEEPQKPEKQPDPAKIPFLEELPVEFRVNVPAFEVNVHVYAEDPSRRFVLVDMKRYRAGDKLASGPRLEAVTADGMVLSWKGRRFRKTAQ